MASDLPLPRSVAEITPSWLTNALRLAGCLAQAQIVTVAARPIGQEIGFLDGLARLQLSYDHAEPDTPTSVVVKLPSTDAAYRQIGDRYNAYERECRFYAEVAPGAGIRLPRCYYRGMDPTSGAYVLMLEDLGGLAAGDQVEGLTQAQAIMAVQSIGVLHAQWWESSALPSLPWMPSRNIQPVRFHQYWPRFRQTVGSHLPLSALALGEKVGANFDWLLQSMEKRPHTIVHSDFRADNLLFDVPSHPDPVVIVDWQLAIRSRGIMDVARLLCGSMSPNDRAACEMTALQHWHRTLENRGVKSYSFEQAVRDYKLGALACLYYPVTIHEAEEAAGNRGKALAAAQIERFFTAAVELEAAALLPT